MLNRLVSVSILSHICQFHFFHFMDDPAVSSRFNRTRQREHRIYLSRKLLIISKQINQTLYIMEYRPCVMPSITFTERSAPLQRIKRFLPFTIYPFTTHKADRLIKYVSIIIHLASKDFLIMLITDHFS